MRRVCERFDPPLEIPAADASLDALVERLDTYDDDGDAFRRARAATAAQFLRRGEYGEALYEALHAHPSSSDASKGP